MAPDNQQNMDCLRSITNYTGKNETWLVFITHGFTFDLNDSWMIPMRESIRLRYGTPDRRIIGAIVGWGAVSSRSLFISPGEQFNCPVEHNFEIAELPTLLEISTKCSAFTLCSNRAFELYPRSDNRDKGPSHKLWMPFVSFHQGLF